MPCGATMRSFAPILSPPLGMFGTRVPRISPPPIPAHQPPGHEQRHEHLEHHEHLRIIHSKTRFSKSDPSSPNSSLITTHYSPRIANLPIRKISQVEAKTGASSRVLLKISVSSPLGRLAAAGPPITTNALLSPSPCLTISRSPQVDQRAAWPSPQARPACGRPGDIGPSRACAAGGQILARQRKVLLNG